jgi:hypothetical protein
MLQPSEARSETLASQAHDPRDESIGALVSRLMEDGRAYARAELDLVKRIAAHRATKAKSGAILVGIGLVLLLCSLTALVLALVLGLATLIGPFAAGMAVFLVLAMAGGLLARSGAKGLAALGGDEDEKTALARAEAHP